MRKIPDEQKDMVKIIGLGIALIAILVAISLL